MSGARKALLVALVLASLSGCGSKNRVEGDDAKSLFGRFFDAKPKATSQAQPGSGGAPIIVVGLSGTDRSSEMVSTGRNATHEVWRAIDGSGVVLNAGILTATHGLGHDLYSADVSDLVPLIQNGRGGLAERIHRYIDGENQIYLKAYRCFVEVGPRQAPLRSEPSLRVVTETCHGTENAFTNIYRIDIGNGKLLSSRQWVSLEIGYIDIEYRAPPPPGVNVGLAQVLIPVHGAN